MKPLVYIETTVVSYLTARTSCDLVAAARQRATQQWWDREREHYDLIISEAVVGEAAQGDEGAAARRLAVLAGLPEVDLTDAGAALAEAPLHPGPIPLKAALDATHIAAAASAGADYLLTWNFKHLANAALRKRIEQTCRSSGYEPPTICTPEELLDR